MAVYPHPCEPRIEVAYSFFGTRLVTPAWFDDNEFTRGADWIFGFWAWCRSKGIVRMRYWGRS